MPKAKSASNLNGANLEPETRMLLEAEYARRQQMAVAKPPPARYWKPRSRPQFMALKSEAEHLFYGGSAGGGKTDLLMGAASTAHRKSLILRREFPQLADIIDRARDILEGTGARYNEAKHVWRNIPGNRKIEFGGCQHEKSKANYRGRAHDLKGFDEITEFTYTQFSFITAWTRTTIPGQRTRVIATGNPPSNLEGRWVIRYWGPWLDENNQSYPTQPGKILYFATIDGKDQQVEKPDPFVYKGMSIIPISRTFIPASLSDNPYLRDTNYASVVNALPEPLRSQLLFGLFSIKSEDDPWQVIPMAWIKAAQQRWRNNHSYSGPATAIGVDVARGGRDRTSITPRYGDIIPYVYRIPGIETPDGESGLREIVRGMDLDPDEFSGGSQYGHRLMTTPLNIDVIGVGASVFDFARKGGFEAYDVNFSSTSGATDHSGALKMFNLRAEAYWMLREALDPGLDGQLALPDDSELEEELSAVRWEMTSRGIKMEDKDVIIERLGRSPDAADSVALAMLDMRSKRATEHVPSESYRVYAQNQNITPTHSHDRTPTRPDAARYANKTRKAKPTRANDPTTQTLVNQRNDVYEPYFDPNDQIAMSGLRQGEIVDVIYDANGNRRMRR